MKLTKLFSLIVLYLFCNQIQLIGQVSISETSSTADDSAVLDLISQDKGFLAPRMTMEERDNISEPATSLLIYQSDNITGFYYNIGTPMSPSWKLLGGESTTSKIPISSLPYAIETSGSYYLTNTIEAGAESGITISASNVSVDLNGYSLMGDGSTSNSAIESTGAISNIQIYNGFVDNWGAHGINVNSSSNSFISGLSISNSSISGIYAGSYATISNCIANNNGFDGISATNHSIISNCIASANGTDGIDVIHQGNIYRCTANQNGGAGIEMNNNGTISQSISNYNSIDGVNSGTGTDIQNSTVSHNLTNGIVLGAASKAIGNLVKSNVGIGFDVQSDSYLSSNQSDSNGLSGFVINGSDNRIDGNQSTDNGGNGFQVTASGNLIIRNSTSGNTAANFSVSAGNTLADIITSATINSNNNPYANISF